MVQNLKGMLRALEKRPLSTEEIDTVLEKFLKKLEQEALEK